jgi:hypothetical protein
MRRTATIALVVVLSLSFSLTAKEFRLTVQSGGAEIVRAETGEQTIVSDSGIVKPNDMVALSEGQQAMVSIEENSLILLRGPASVTMNHSGSQLIIALEDGQLLLDREQPYTLSALSITSKKFTFTPMGTCAAIKTDKQKPPTTAVVKGKMRMQSPTGEAVVVDEGNYGSVGSNNKLSTGKLSPRAVESLNGWLGSAPRKKMKNTPPPHTKAMSPSAKPGNQLPPPKPSQPPQTTTAPAAAASTPAPAPASAPAPVPVQQQASARAAPSTPAATAPQAAPADEKPDPASEEQAAEEPAPPKAGAQKIDKTPAPPSSPKWEISAGSATIDNEQWTRLALGIDVPLWKFGVFFDVEFFIDNDGNFSDKGWNFDEDWRDALMRKIRYIRFGQEGDPLFIKFGGLSSVTMGYGFIVDRFTNMLHYPDQKLLGLQFDLNDLTPIGLSLQTLIPDFRDFDYDGGMGAVRLGFKPLKMTGIPIVKGITFSGTYAKDFNQYAPARTWDFTLKGDRWDKDLDKITDSTFYYNKYHEYPDVYEEVRAINIEDNDFDTVIEHRDQWASRREDAFGLFGGDIGIPIISTSILSLDIYGQAGIRDDKKHGWGIGAPGVALKLWRFWANIEYRRVQGRFQPGYFGTYYLDERLIRDPEISTKEERLIKDTLNGVFGRLGFNIADVLLIDGSYQYMVGREDKNKDQRFEAIGSLGDLILQKIPKLNRAEIYYYKTRIGIEEDTFFEKTPFMYFGYRTGFEISQGASLIWDARYGYMYDENGNLVANNNISVHTAITF